MFGKIKKGLDKTRGGVFSKINRLLTARRKIDEDLLEELEELLITADVGVGTTMEMLDRIRARVKKEKYQTADELNGIIMEAVRDELTFEPFEPPQAKPLVILMIGVNGTGKTTSTAKLAHHYRRQGKQVMLAAADTFRAAAIDQLATWGERLGVRVIKHQANSDPAAVVFDACTAALAADTDVLIIDTAGRLHNKVNLMNELEKINRVIERQIPGAPHEVVLVLDAGNGQNAVQQAREFIKVARVNALFLSKLDGTAKGGVVIGIKNELGIPVRYIGVGEKVEDMELFNAEEFVEGLFNKE
ncbi:MAG TPA: signal recognition particle-docking protein FtsY [Caldithrix abyssi]|uniref:Signal recognition particle receptor FtsY n=1 Tax=Caldithrix abyssi TaxID=187145 RepID=A0A7V1LJF5_CALAY|nr:signal recognition particle-docking protein FtsY [Caldithrix abyssi]